MEDLESLRKAADGFEKRMDEGDEDQVELLSEIRKRIKDLERLRGKWNKRTTQGDWNRYQPDENKRAPLELKAYKEYKEHVDFERNRSVQVDKPFLLHADSQDVACQGNSPSVPQEQG